MELSTYSLVALSQPSQLLDEPSPLSLRLYQVRDLSPYLFPNDIEYMQVISFLFIDKKSAVEAYLTPRSPQAAAEAICHPAHKTEHKSSLQ